MLSFLGSTPIADPTAQIKAASAAPIEYSTRIFQGWIVVVAAFTMILIAYGIQFSFFVVPIS
jgi:hypothetical protein